MDLNLFKTLSKYPFVHENEFYDSVELRQNKTCYDKCDSKDCLILASGNTNLQEYICSKGYNNLLLIIGKLKFILNGIMMASKIVQMRKFTNNDINTLFYCYYSHLDGINYLYKNVFKLAYFL